ncbi:glycosyltransferase [Nocardia farcinica]|nr:glycosyltransferase [Nocardia farcinica]MBF6279462.1 glycosyltransferase [Nocardia farcinica]MBF6303878.1 glycosyltransferase [Nocardia farcinica]MBF6388920.1 glycosyltransferase [Nocardia farcinica]MBF6489570.1 glycosyltransferase [Nocardia farcinica]
MKIALVSEHASPLAEPGGPEGGQQLHVAELAAALARRGHSVTVYTRRVDPHTRTEVLTRPGYRVVHVPAGPPEPLPRDRTLPHLGEFGTFLRRHWLTDRPQLVHAHFWMSALAAELAARAFDIPVVVTFHALGTVKRRHQGLADTSPPSRIRFERLIATRARHILATSVDEAVELVRMGVPRFRISVVPSGVDVTAFTPGGAAADRKARHRLLCAGKLLPRKGFDVAVRAMPELPGTELVIAGGAVGDDVADDAETKRLRRLAAECGVGDRVRLLGRVSHSAMPRLYRSADAVLAIPRYEPFGLVALEAMACGRPVVATAVGGMLDAVVDGVTGRFVAPAAPETVARAVRPLLDDDVLRRTWGAAGCERVRERYSWDRVAQRTLAVYHRAAPTRDSALARELVDPALSRRAAPGPRHRHGEMSQAIRNDTATSAPAADPAAGWTTMSTTRTSDPTSATPSSARPAIAQRWAAATTLASRCRRNRIRCHDTGATNSTVAPKAAATVAR